ncbi:MAG: hypothetical protein NUV49_02765 [Patescibacteria group bacterium]|nr:hypothetical protein [Patescibacteria group bacterium]
MALPVWKHVTEKGVEVITSNGGKSFKENDDGTVAKVIMGKRPLSADMVVVPIVNCLRLNGSQHGLCCCN